MMSRTFFLILYILLASHLSIVAQNPIGLRASATLRGLTLGTEVEVFHLQENVDDGQYISNIKKNYQLIVPGGEMKAMHVWLGDNIYNFSDPDWLLGSTLNSTGWVQQNGMQLQASTLLWGLDRHIPTWILDQEASLTPEKTKSLLSDYIHTFVGRYRGKISSWVIMNEAIDDRNINIHPFNLRDCLWLRKLGVDWLKYAFIFAHEADPNVPLYWNDFNVEYNGFKINHTLDAINWLRSEGAVVNGIGMEWHTDSTRIINPQGVFYQTARQVIKEGLDFMITEIDVTIPMKNGKPVDPKDLEKQGILYGSALELYMNFTSHSPAMVSWGFTDRYSWIPEYWNYTKGEALPLDASYQPKRAYYQMQEILARVVNDAVYCLSPESQPEKYLGVSENTTSGHVQLYSGKCDNANEKWNITWLEDGTYRLAPISANDRALEGCNTTATIGGVQISTWSGNETQQWVFSPKGNNTFRVGPRTAWARVMAVYGTDDIGIVDYSDADAQNWILTTV